MSRPNFHPYYVQLNEKEQEFVSRHLSNMYKERYFNLYEHVIDEPDQANDLQEAFAKFMLQARRQR